ncbi:transposable element Tcb2 transposase [Trichonephila clavipes]|nr:transposable element Tcb2 transposase [Trichonephila clavipes]
MKVQRCVDNVLSPVTFLFLRRLPIAPYQQDNAQLHIARNSQRAYQNIQMLLWPPILMIFQQSNVIGHRLHVLSPPCSEDELRNSWKEMNSDSSVLGPVDPREEFKRRPGSGHPRQTSRREDRYIVRNARIHPTASSAAIQAHVAPSLGAPVSSRTIRRRLAEGHLGSRRPLRVLPLTPTFGVVPRMRKLDCSRREPGRL